MAVVLVGIDLCRDLQAVNHTTKVVAAVVEFPDAVFAYSQMAKAASPAIFDI
jgi:hypothetical protein